MEYATLNRACKLPRAMQDAPEGAGKFLDAESAKIRRKLQKLEKIEKLEKFNAFY
jgi:hypothetical protein